MLTYPLEELLSKGTFLDSHVRLLLKVYLQSPYNPVSKTYSGTTSHLLECVSYAPLTFSCSELRTLPRIFCRYQARRTTSKAGRKTFHVLPEDCTFFTMVQSKAWTKAISNLVNPHYSNCSKSLHTDGLIFKGNTDLMWDSNKTYP